MKPRQLSYWESERLNLEGAIDLSLASLRAYGQDYKHWSISYSGGKDSTATVTLIAWAIKAGLIPAPASLTVLYADTRQEYPPLHQSAMSLLAQLRSDGFNARVVMPEIESRFYVYMLGRGVPPPRFRFRWCTERIKVRPMLAAMADVAQEAGEKVLMITGVRLGESAARDQRIAISCSSDSGECGQGWFQQAKGDAIADTLAPLIHWRVCHVFDWLYFEQPRHGYDATAGIAAVYGDDDVRTGCIGCNLVQEDKPLKKLVSRPEFEYLKPLMQIKPLFKYLNSPSMRLRRTEDKKLTKSGKIRKQIQALGPLHMEARAYGLERVLDIQAMARVDLINAEEERAIRQMWADGVWPDGWTGNEPEGDAPRELINRLDDHSVTVQPQLIPS